MQVRKALLGPVTEAFLALLPPLQQPLTEPRDQDAADAESAAALPVTSSDASATVTTTSSSGTVAAAVRDALAEAATAVHSSGRGLAEAVTDEVVERCVVVVRQLKGITATYRMTSKAPPVRASHYVVGILTPLRQLLETAAVKRLTPYMQQVRTECFSNVFACPVVTEWRRKIRMRATCESAAAPWRGMDTHNPRMPCLGHFLFRSFWCCR